MSSDRFGIILAGALCLCACGDSPNGSSTSLSTNASTGGAGGQGVSGQTASAGGQGGEGGNTQLTPPAAGIDGCAAMFLDADGVCRPTIEKCPQGQIPDIDAGCVPVGVPSCAPELLDAHGFCAPSLTPCADGTFPVPSLGCVSIDGDDGCGTGTWGNVPDDPANVYVDLSYPNSDSDGSKAKPFTTISAALTVVQPGGQVVVAAGHYMGDLGIAFAVTLRGVCASKVTLSDSEVAAVFVDANAGDEVTLRGFTTDSHSLGIDLISGNTTIDEVQILHAGFGIDAHAGTVTSVTRSLVQDTVNGSGLSGTGIAVAAGAEMHISQSAVVRAIGKGVSAYGSGSLLTLDDVVVDDVLDDTHGGGVSWFAGDGAVLTADGSISIGSATGLYLSLNANATVTHSTIARSGVAQGDGVYSEKNSTATFTGDVFEGLGWTIDVDNGSVISSGNLSAYPKTTTYGNVGFAVATGSLKSEKDVVVGAKGAAFLVNGTCSLDGDVIEDVAVDTAAVGAGTGVLVGGSLSIDRSYITGATDYGVLATSNGTSRALSIKKSVIEKMVGLGGSILGVGIAVGGPQMTLDLQDTLVEDVLGAGVEVSGAKGSIARTLVRRVGLSEVSPASYPVSNHFADGVGDGILSIGGGDLSITDSWVETCARGAVVLSGGSHQLSGVRGTQSVFGLALQDGATATVNGSNFSGNSTANKSDPATLDVPPYP